MSLNLLKNYSILTVFLLMQLITNGSAIKCFVCDSSDNPSCADLESNSSIVAEECTLDKMRSIDTWLFELNKISYFDTGANKSPLMNCQKVVARDPNTNKMVTARFCQLNTGESDACQILRTKLNLPKESGGDTRMTQNNLNNNNQNGRRMVQQQQQQQNDAEQFHCSNCYTDNCNGASVLKSNEHLLIMNIMTMMMIMIIMKIVPVQQILISRLW
ncbi:without maturity [Cochliomyia hominivorax]